MRFGRIRGDGEGDGVPTDDQVTAADDALDGDAPADDGTLNGDVPADGIEDDAVDEDPETEVELEAEELEEEFDEELEHAAAKAEKSGPSAIRRLYRGETSFDFIGRRKWWFAISAIVILAGIISFGTRGLNEGIDFKGGTSWTVPTQTLTVAQATTTAKAAGVPNPTVVLLTNQVTHQKQIEVQADLNNETTTVHNNTVNAVQNALAKAGGVSSATVSVTDVGPTWGGQVTNKAIEALILFFIAVAIYISIRFEYKMAVAAIVAVIHDLLVTVGIYSLTGFQVTPDTVIAVLTVLGYSLYDTVVVFDRIGENAKGLGASGRITYSDMVNLSMNQTLARSINTSLVAIIPVLSVLIVGSLILGATTLQDFGLALVIGLTSGAYSSIFIASPLLALMKEREPRYTTIRQRLETRGDRLGILTPSMAAAMVGAAAGPGGGRGGRNRPAAGGVVRPGAAAQAARAAKAGAARTGSSGAGPARNGSSSPSPSGGSRSGAGSTRPAGNRPPPRPRKGKGKGGKGKRR
jgi:preprotein translocase subunit SecF